MDPFEALRYLPPSPSSSSAPSFSFGRRVTAVNIEVSVREVQVSADKDLLQGDTLCSQPMAPSQLKRDESTGATDDIRGKKRKPTGPHKHPLTFSQAPFKPGDHVTCVIIQSGSGQTQTETVVPLWPQVTAHWSKRDLQSQRWLRVRSDQQWLQMVCLLAKLSLKDRKSFADHIQKQIVRSLVKKREAIATATLIGSDSDGSDPEDEDSQDSRSTIKTFAIKVEIGGRCVTCLNNGVQLAVQADTDAQRFISEYVYNEALKFRSAPESQTSPTSAGTGDKQVASVQGWEPTRNWTPNHKDKVQWNVGTSRFDVFVRDTKCSKGAFRIHHFYVPCDLEAKPYQEYKKNQYDAAVKSWNCLDHGTRDRIKPISVT